MCALEEDKKENLFDQCRSQERLEKAKGPGHTQKVHALPQETTQVAKILLLKKIKRALGPVDCRAHQRQAC